MLPNDNVSMSIGHLDHVLTVLSFLCSLILIPNFLHVSTMYELEQFLQDVIKMSDGHENVIR